MYTIKIAFNVKIFRTYVYGFTASSRAIFKRSSRGFSEEIPPEIPQLQVLSSERREDLLARMRRGRIGAVCSFKKAQKGRHGEFSRVPIISKPPLQAEWIHHRPFIRELSMPSFSGQLKAYGRGVSTLPADAAGKGWERERTTKKRSIRRRRRKRRFI